MKAVYNDAVSVPLRPLIITGGKVAKNKKYRKGWLEYYDLDSFLKSIPQIVKNTNKKSNITKLFDSDSDYEDV